MARILIALLISILVGCEPPAPSPPSQLHGKAVKDTYSGKVIGVTDGDTFTVLVSETQTKVRFDSIDAPERKQPFGSKAKTALSDLIFGKVVTVHKTGTSWERDTAFVTMGDLDINLAMVRSGFAWEYPKYSRSGDFEDAQVHAQEQQLGLWSETGPVPPWEWRKR